jgi:hypothetical protein
MTNEFNIFFKIGFKELQIEIINLIEEIFIKVKLFFKSLVNNFNMFV